MDEVHEVTLVDTLIERALKVVQAVPSHVRNLLAVQGGAEALDICGEDAQTVGVALFAVAAHQLHAYANAQHRLMQLFDKPVEATVAQMLHGICRLALTGKQHTVGFAYLIRLVGDIRLYAKPPHCVGYGTDIAGVIFYDGYVHF